MDFTINKDHFLSPWPALVLITITGAVIYSNIYHAPFAFDDAGHIIDKRIRDLSYYFSLEQILKPRNIVHITIAINYKLSKLNVFGYHLVNVLIHILNGFLVYFLSLTIFKKLNKISQSPDSTRLPVRTGLGQVRPAKPFGRAISLMALFTALIFVAHPIQTQAVTYTIQRAASMAAMFCLASVFFYLKARITAPCLRLPVPARQTGATHRQESRYSLTCYVLSGFCGMLAFLSKQNMASLPGAILLIEYLLINRTWQGWKKIMPWYALSFTLWVIFVLYVSGFFSGEFSERNLFEDISSLSKETVDVSRWQYLCTQFNVLVIYVRLLFLPVNQNLDYLYPFKDGFFDGYTPIAFLFLAGLVAIGVWSIRKRPIITLAIFWFFITLSVESSIIPIRDALFEHRLYLPMFGFAVFAASLLFHYFSNKRSRVIVVYIVIIISLGAATYHRNMVWRDDVKLWTDSVSKNPKNHRAHNNLGLALTDQERFEEAVGHYHEALRIKPNYPKAHSNLGLALAGQGRFDEAIFHYKEALRINPNFEEAHNNMGIVLLQKGSFDEAISHCKEALRIVPDYENAHLNLGNALLRQDKIDEAISHYKEALRINPDYAESHNNIGIALAGKNKLSEAIAHFSEAIIINPNYADAHNNIGLVLTGKGELNEAIKHFSEALRIKPDFKVARNNLEIALKKAGKEKRFNQHD